MGWESGADIEGLAIVARGTRGPNGEVLPADLLAEFDGEDAFGLGVEAFGERAHVQALLVAAALLAEQPSSPDHALLWDRLPLRIGRQHRRQSGRCRHRAAEPLKR